MGALIRAEKSSSMNIDEENEAKQGKQYLTFLVGDELFALAIADIKEIIEYSSPSIVPMMPPYLRGVINLRGRIVPVIDLMIRFGRKSSVVTRRTCIIVLEIYHNEELQYIGVVVDAVKAVLDIADADIEQPPSFGAKLRSDFISGMGNIKGEFIIILDIENVLSIDELSKLDNMTDSPQNQLEIRAEEKLDEQISEKSHEESLDKKLTKDGAEEITE